MAEIEITLDDEKIPSAACLLAQLVEDEDRTTCRDIGCRKNKRSRRRWSKKSTETTKCWARKAVTLKFYHVRAAQYYDKVSKWLAAPIAFLTAAIGTGIVAIAANDSQSIANTVVLWILAGLSYAVVGLSAANSEIDPAKLSERHLHKAICWNSIYDDLVVELSLPKHKKHDAIHFLSTVRTNMAYAEQFPPVLPEWIYKTDENDVMYKPMHRELEVFNRRFGMPSDSANEQDQGSADEAQKKPKHRFRDLVKLQRFRDTYLTNLWTT